jgi:hypothetical protein
MMRDRLSEKEVVVDLEVGVEAAEGQDHLRILLRTTRRMFWNSARGLCQRGAPIQRNLRHRPSFRLWLVER